MGKVISTRHGFKRTSFNFYENLKFKSPVLLGLLLLIEVVLILILVEQELSGRLWGMRPLNSIMIVAILVLIPSPLLILYIITKFETIINDDGIFYRWLPFNSSYHIYDWSGIREVSIIESKVSRIGKSNSKSFGEVHNLGSKFALFITTKSGRRKTISTRKPEELNRILIRIAGDKYNNSSEHNFEYN